jgi:hypothetical protein
MTPVILSAHTPVRPRFTKKRTGREEFWRLLADTPHIRGLDSRAMKSASFGDEWLFRHAGRVADCGHRHPGNHASSRGGNGFGLASSDEEQRRACVEFHRHLHNKINAVNQRFANKVISLELQAAPLAVMLMWSRQPRRLPAPSKKSPAGTGHARCAGTL